MAIIPSTVTGTGNDVFSFGFQNVPGFFGLDNLSLTAVPEPSTWAMMIVGFGLVGAAARRRKSAGRTTAPYCLICSRNFDEGASQEAPFFYEFARAAQRTAARLCRVGGGGEIMA